MFFYQTKRILRDKRMQLYITLKEFEVADINKFLLAFDYFCQNPHDFDGATIVKDLETIKGLDACAMVHDYEYLHIDFFTLKGLKAKFISDFNFGKNMEQTGKGIFVPYSRVALLWLSTPFYYLIFKL